jgi:hypothetical protein
MGSKAPNPRHQQETEFTGELQEFSGPALSPDDPSLEPRVRRARPADTRSAAKKKTEPKERD